MWQRKPWCHARKQPRRLLQLMWPAYIGNSARLMLVVCAVEHFQSHCCWGFCRVPAVEVCYWLDIVATETTPCLSPLLLCCMALDCCASVDHKACAWLTTPTAWQASPLQLEECSRTSARGIHCAGEHWMHWASRVAAHQLQRIQLQSKRGKMYARPHERKSRHKP